jgi:hypothetical protein
VEDDEDEIEDWLDADDDGDADVVASDAVDAEADDDALAELDEALASEEPEKLKRSFFRRG